MGRATAHAAAAAATPARLGASAHFGALTLEGPAPLLRVAAALNSPRGWTHSRLLARRVRCGTELTAWMASQRAGCAAGWGGRAAGAARTDPSPLPWHAAVTNGHRTSR